VKVWDKRESRISTAIVDARIRNIKIALRRLRKFARTGAPDELDLDTTIRETANHGYLDVHMPARAPQRGEVLVFFDIGGSMDSHIEPGRGAVLGGEVRVQAHGVFLLPQLLYEGVWKQTSAAHERTPTWDVLIVPARLQGGVRRRRLD